MVHRKEANKRKIVFPHFWYYLKKKMVQEFVGKKGRRKESFLWAKAKDNRKGGCS